MRYAFYPGCAVHSSSKEYGDSCKAISKVLDIELVEIPDWNCCGAIDAIYSYKPLYSVAIDARNLSLAERMGMDIVTLCSACFFTLSRTNKLLREDAGLKNKVEEALSSAGLNYNGGVKVRHFLEVLLSDVGLERIRAKVKIPLTALSVASYYGCLLVRPPNLTDFDDPEHPTRLDELVETLGASKVEYYSKTRCCGASLGVTKEEVMLELSKNILLDAKNAGANCMITACPLCHFNLDAKQKDIESKFDLKIDLPIFHFTQLIGLAFGIKPKELGLHRNCVSPKKILPQYAGSVA
ncbi:MAG: CoB--CoM heterodisulfide reductase iron-sulfur subunit B family protein [Candidatus Bathyarchaeia archaeon]